MVPRKRTGAKGPSPLSKEKVIDAALDLADEAGVTSLTMRKLADKLGVEAMSIYYHVANKNEILDAILDAIFSEIELPSPDDTDWKSAMRNRAMSAREVVLKHKWDVALMESRPNPGPATMHHHNAVLGALRTNGFSLPLAAHAFSVIDSYVYGFVMQEEALPFETEEELKAVADGIMAQFPIDDFPHLGEMIVDHALKAGYSYKKEFEFGLDLILNGLEKASQNEAS